MSLAVPVNPPAAPAALQPDYILLTNTIRQAAAQIEWIPNVPDLANLITDLTKSVNTLITDLGNVRMDVATLKADVSTLTVKGNDLREMYVYFLHAHYRF
jgi:hypothetical protein